MSWLDRLRQNSLARDVLALVITAVACPVAVAAQWLAGCVGQGVTASCAMSAAWVSPVLLAAAGIAAGLSTRGWTGLLIVYVGGVIGMVSIVGLAFLAGHNIPFDPMSGIVATIWFMAPVTGGYMVARLAWHVREWMTRGGGAPTA
jgi:hypothetical protein